VCVCVRGGGGVLFIYFFFFTAWLLLSLYESINAHKYNNNMNLE